MFGRKKKNIPKKVTGFSFEEIPDDWHIDVRSHETYHVVAHSTINSLISAAGDRRRRRELAEGEEPTEEVRKEIEKIEAYSTAFKTVPFIYSALCLEALINFYGDRLKIQFADDLERTTTQKKWKMYPVLAGFKQIEPEPLRRVDLLFKLRDQLVHQKGKSIPGKKAITSQWFEFPQMAYAVNTILIATRALGERGLDSSFTEFLMPSLLEPEQEWKKNAPFWQFLPGARTAGDDQKEG